MEAAVLQALEDGTPRIVLECRDLDRDIFGKHVLRAVSFEVTEGNRLAILGPNGAGKTTLIRVCMGLLRATRGSVRVWNQDPVAEGPSVRARCGVATEESAAYPGISVLENLVLWGNLFGMSASEARDKARVELETFGALRLSGQAAGTLSAGERKRLGLARAFMTAPELLVLDEPTAGLDFETRRTLRRRLTEHDGGRIASVIIASHEIDEIERVATHLLLLSEGRVCEFGPIEEVLRGRPLEELVEERFFAEPRPLTIE